MADDTLFASMQDQRKRKARDLMLSLLKGVTAGVQAGHGIPVSDAVASAQRTFALDKADPYAAEKMWALGQLVELEKSRDRIKEAEHAGVAQAIKAKYEGVDKLLGHLADVYQKAQEGQAGVARDRVTSMGTQILELRKQMAERGVQGMDQDKISTYASRLKGYYDGLVEQGVDPADIFTDPQQEIPTAISELISQEGDSRLVRAVLEEADLRIDPSSSPGTNDGFYTRLLSERKAPEGTDYDVSHGFGSFPDRAVAPLYTLSSMSEDGRRRLAEDESALMGIGGMLSTLEEESKRIGVTSGSRDVASFWESAWPIAKEIGLLADPSEKVTTSKQVAEGGERPAGGVGHMDDSAPSASEALWEFYNSLSDPNPTAQAKRAEIMAGTDFQEFQKQRGLETPEAAWRQLGKEVQASRDDARIRDKGQMQTLGARPEITAPDVTEAAEAEAKAEVAPVAAAAISGRPVTSVVSAERDAYGRPLTKETAENAVTAADLAKITNDFYKKKAEARLGGLSGG